MTNFPPMGGTAVLPGMSPDSAAHDLALTMRLRDRSGVACQRIGRTKLFLDGCNPALAAQVCHSLEKFHRDFPHVAAKLATVNLMPMTYGYACTTQYAGSPTFDIALNEHMYGAGPQAETDMNRHLSEDFLTGFHRFNRPISNFEHELGHVLDMSLDFEGARQLVHSDARHISGYADVGGPEEAFAEAFANVREGLSNGKRVDEIVARVCRSASKAGNLDWWFNAA